MSETKSSQRFHCLNAEQVEVLHQVLSEMVPIHGRGNFPTLELRPRDIIIAVRARLEKQGITVRDVRLNGSTASHVLVRDNGTSYKDLDIIFGVELPSQEEFQVIKESVLGCLLDCLPAGVNRERISSATMKEAYVQKMVKVFNEHDRWSLISLSNNSGKNLELKFVSVLRRQFEFSVDSFQIILDRLLESYLQQESQHASSSVDHKDQDQTSEKQSKDSPATAPETESLDPTGGDSAGGEEAQMRQKEQRDEAEDEQEKESHDEVKDSARTEDSTDEKISDQTSLILLLETKPLSDDIEPISEIELRQEPESSDETKGLTEGERSAQTQPPDGKQRAHSGHEEDSTQEEPPNQTNQPGEEEELAEEVNSSQTQTETLNLAGESHMNDRADKTDFSECFGEDQSDEKDALQHFPVPDASTPTQPQTESLGERKVETETKNDTETSEMTEETTETETEHEELAQAADDSSSSSLTSQVHDTQPASSQETPEIHGTPHAHNSEETPNAEDVNPPDTQDILPTPPGLASDKKTSSLPSSKASDRLSHMVVLKHSSPKPPRRMCRKVIPNPHAGPASESEPAAAPGPDPNPEPEIASSPKPNVTTGSPRAVRSDFALTMTTAVPIETERSESEANPSTDPAPGLDHVSPLITPDPPPDIISTSTTDPTSALPEEPLSSQLMAEDSCETTVQDVKETPSSPVTLDEQSPPSPRDSASPPKQSEPPDSPDTFVPRADCADANTQDPVCTSEAELSDEDELRELQADKTGSDQPTGPPRDSAVASSTSPHCLTPPVLSLSPPCFTPSPRSLSPPPSLTPPAHCVASPSLTAVSPAPSFSSPPLSFSPTSSCLSSPPYLTPPMLSLSPPPLCFSPPSPCISPPLLCLTPPVEAEDLAPQVPSDLEPLIVNTETEEPIKPSTPQPGAPLPQPGEKNGDISEPVSFPVTITSSTSAISPHSQAEDPRESSPKHNEASVSVPENKEAPEVTPDKPEQSKPPPVSDSVPVVEVLAESMYGDFDAAMDHLRYRLIATRNPEEIRGGGLLKYSNLLVRDYRPASETQIKTLERYMCSRFFIDFPDVQEQQRKILSYLKNHFIGEERSKYQYLMTLRRVVDDSTVCLMGHERRQTLNMITVLALKVLGEQNIIPNTDHVTCFYQPAPYLAEHSAPYIAEPSYCSYYIPQGGSTLLYQPYPLHLHTQTGLV